MPSPLNILRRVRRHLSSPSLRVAVYPKVSWYWKLIGFSGLVGLMVIFGWVSFDMGRQSAGAIGSKKLITQGAILLILIGNAFYAHRCIFRTSEYINQYGFGDGSAIMTRLVGTFAAGLQ